MTDYSRSGMPKVVFHGFDPEGARQNQLGLSTIDEAVDVTGYVSRLSWTHSVQQPWETIELTMSVPQSQIQTVLPGPPVGSTGITGDGTVRQPSTGFWVVLYALNEDRDGNEIWSALHWGVCSRLRLTGEVEQSTGAQFVRVSVSCESWVSQLARNTICMAPGSTWIRDGYSYDLRQWGDELSALLQGSVNRMPGEVFADLYRAMTPQLIPTTLSSFSGTFTSWNQDGRAEYEFGDFLPTRLEPEELAEIGITDLNAATVSSRAYAFRDAIKLVWNRELCQRHAPLRALNHKAVTGWGLGSIGSPLPRGTTWGYWQSSFFPIPEIECFPSMEWPVYGRSPRARAVYQDTVQAASAYAEAAVDLTIGSGTYWYETTLQDLEARPDWSGDLEFQTLSETKDELVPFEGYLEESLGGASPVLIYRMKPTLFSPLNALELTDRARRRWGPEITLDDPSTAELYYSIESAPTASEKVGINQRTQTVSPESNLEGDPWVRWTADQVYSFDVMFDESNRVNALYAKTPLQPQSQMELHGLLGNPIVDTTDVGKHGLRLKTVDWPFLPPSVDIEVEYEGQTQRATLGTLQDRLTAQGEELWTAAANSDTSWIYGKGSMRGVYKPWLKAGVWISLQWDGAWIPYSASPEGEADRNALGDTPGWTGYANTISHDVEVDNTTGSVRASTTVQLDRLSMARGANVVPAVSALPTDAYVPDGRAFIVNDQGQRVTGSIQVNEDGTIEFVPDPVAG